MKRKLIALAVTLYSCQMYAQSTAGLQLLKDERWWSAETEFSKSQSDEDIFYKGYSQMKMDEPAKAKESFNSIATKPYGKIGMGWIELNGGNVDGANKLFQAAADETKNKNPNILIAISKAIASSSATNKETAIEWAKKAVETQKTNADFRLALGDAYMNTQDGGNAITQFEYAEQYDPSSAQPLAKIGQVYFRSRTYDLSRDYLQKALAKNPNNLLALNYLAQIYYKYRKYDTAKIYQTKILELGDKNPEDMAMMANIDFLGKDYNSAINTITAVIKGNNKYNYLNRLIGYSYYETGKPEEAKQFLTKFIETQPKDKILFEDYKYLGKTYFSLGDSAAAANAFETGYKMKPEEKENIDSIATFYKTAKKFSDAAKYYEILTRLPEPTKNDFANLATSYYSCKDFNNAEIAYTKLIEVSPSNVGAYYTRAIVRQRLDPKQETASAKPDYIKFIELAANDTKYNPQIIKANLYLAKDAILNLKDNAAAKGYIEKVIVLDPANAEAAELMKHVN